MKHRRLLQLRSHLLKMHVDAEVQAAQATWDAQTDEEKADPMNTRPADITLEE